MKSWWKNKAEDEKKPAGLEPDDRQTNQNYLVSTLDALRWTMRKQDFEQFMLQTSEGSY